MNKLWLIIGREYLTRVKKKTFILATILTPIAFALFFLVSTLIFSYEGGEENRIAVLDESGILKESNIKSSTDTKFVRSKESLKNLKDQVTEGTFDAILVIPPLRNTKTSSHKIHFYAEKSPNLTTSSVIEKSVQKAVRKYKAKQLGFEEEKLKALDTYIEIDPKPISDSGQDASAMTSVIGAAIGGLMGLIMYFALFIYGMMVMRSVMEEKMNRIVEVMISSVKPFQLMLGKIIGVGAVGLTQLAIWAILIPLMYLIVIVVFGIDPSSASATGLDPEMASMAQEEGQEMLLQVAGEIQNQNWSLMIPLFILFFLGGYILYSSMFAAVGSAMGDDMGEGQALTIPITIPVILAIYIMTVAIRSPESPLAVWSSIFPLFSPIVMPARLAFDPPMWQILLSSGLLIGTSVLFVWLSGRIYRVGILLYGKKAGFKEIAKWVFKG